MGKTVRVAAAVIVQDHQIFAVQRGYGEFRGLWEFPGGKIEESEEPKEALLREIREELDTEVEIEKPADLVEYDYPQFHLILYCFWCKVKSGNLVLKEHEAARWLTKETMESVDWLPADWELIRKLKTML